jgi:hypothetical protein
MSRYFTPKIITANSLLEGDVVYLTQDDEWSGSHAQAEFIEDEAHAQLRFLDAARQVDKIVGVYLADAQMGVHGPEPVHFREAFRTRGPSNYAHGKQAEH